MNGMGQGLSTRGMLCAWSVCAGASQGFKAVGRVRYKDFEFTGGRPFAYIEGSEECVLMIRAV